MPPLCCPWSCKAKVGRVCRLNGQRACLTTCGIVGDGSDDAEVEALPGFKPAKSMVFAGVYPEDGSQYESVRIALNKLTLNDASISVQQEVSAALGAGFRCAASAHISHRSTSPFDATDGAWRCSLCARWWGQMWVFGAASLGCGDDAAEARVQPGCGGTLFMCTCTCPVFTPPPR